MILEIRAAEGGDDAKLLVHDQWSIYEQAAKRYCLDLRPLDVTPGCIVASINGPHVEQIFANESGGHRWQRIPPTERHDRVHTSTVTVAVLHEPTDGELRIPDSDLDITTTRGSGPGGQNRNKVESVIVIRHKPTGITVRVEDERSQHLEAG